jgi:isocitrate lyase
MSQKEVYRIFKPQLTPKKMLELGVFGGAYFVDGSIKEFAREKDGYTSVKHQREVGTSYFDSVSKTISSGMSSTTAMSGSTEEEQF